MDSTGKLRLGACSWKFPSWQGLIYSVLGEIDYLGEYAQRYDTVEVDQWFWSRFDLDQVTLPDPADVERYRASVSDDFRFTVKAPNSVTLTHLYRASKSEALVANPSFLDPRLVKAFLRRLAPLYDVLGPVMFQFEYLNRQKMESQRVFWNRFATFVEQLPPGYAYALEVRNGQYMNAEHFQSLLAHGVVPVLLQGYWMPPIWEVYAAHRELILGQPEVVLRLLGPDREGIEQQTGKRWHQIVAPKDEELPRIVDVVRDLLNEGVNVYVNVNNHYEGSAPVTIERLQALLE